MGSSPTRRTRFLWRPTTAVCRAATGSGRLSARTRLLLGVPLPARHLSWRWRPVGRSPWVWRLRITMDLRYPRINDRVCSALRAVGGHRVGVVRRSGWVEIGSYWKHWICLFPQHGRGARHLRRIELTDWQRALVTLYPDEVRRRSDPLRRLPLREPCEGQRISPLLLHERVRRHPSPVHHGVWPPGDRVSP